jgi:exosortase
MIPLPQVWLIGLTFRLKMLAAQAAGGLVSLLHIPAHIAGGMVYLPNGTLTVGDECSGIHSLFSLLTLSLVFFYLSEKNTVRRILLVAVSLPLAIVANIFRITFLISAAYVYGVEAALNGILHYGAGLALWGTAILLLLGIRRVTAWHPLR